VTKATTLLACLLMAAALTVGCGGDDTSNNSSAAPLDKLAQISGVTELAADAWAAAGPAGLYDYLDDSVTAHCTKEQLEATLKDQELPTAFQGVDSVVFQGADAHATLNLVFPNDHRKVEWVLAPVGNSWRLTSVPGLEKCAGST
jgi:hypothetical protein